MQPSDRFLDAMLRDEIRRLNAHLPTIRKTLSDLLEQDSPTIPSVGGQEIRLRKDELEDLASILPDDGRNRIKLPLVAFRRKELGLGAYTILGDPYEEYAVSFLTGSFKGTFQEFKEQISNPPVFYKPQISELIRRYHSLVVIGFGASDSPSGDR